MLRTLSQCYNGDEENDFQPIKQFIVEMNNYPELWEVAQKIEGLICGSGIHAGGVIFVDEPFTESTALMRAPDGTICTQFELHDAEAVSLIKYDALSVEAMDKIHNCIDLLCDAGLVEREPSLKDTYENIIGIYNIERDDPKMWQMVWNHEITSLFQMEKQSGISGIATLKPTSVDDLATLNSVIRLMAQEKGGEMPTDKLARFKAQPQLWDEEMIQWGLTDSERTLLHKELDTSYGICESQEGFMQLVQIPECGGFNLTWADRLRKSIAKKHPKEFNDLTKEYYENIKNKNLSYNLCNYVWKVLVAYSRGYGFNKSHTLSYSLIALQEMNLAYKYPIIFWNCACLITDAGGDEKENEDEEEVIPIEQNFDEIEDFGVNGEENEDEDENEEDEGTQVKKKKKTVAVNYGKIATAIGKMRMAGIVVEPPDINKSTYTFSPDMDANIIRYGISGITRVGEDVVKQIIANRPYTSITDFLSKVKVNKVQMINLIKSGAFDSFGARVDIMQQYIDMISDTKKRVTLQNMKMLIDFQLLPSEFEFCCKVFNYNKYLKKLKLDDKYYGLDSIAFNFYSNNFDIDTLEPANTESSFKLSQTKWDKIYQQYMDKVRPYVKKNQSELLNAINNRLTTDVWNKYCLGSLSKWEMDSVSFYSHEHELAATDLELYNICNFFELPETPEVERIIPIKGKQVPIFKLNRIAGTVLDRDKAKKTVSLLTTTGVVTVKIYGAFEAYDRQISVKGPDGKKHVIEKSMFSRGNKIIVTGIRQEDAFVAKVYSRTPWHRVEQIVDIQNNHLVIKTERAEVE